jgi:LysM repeat protein
MRRFFRGGCWILLCGTLWAGELPTHTITRGETLYSIARQHDVTVPQLLQSNPGLQPEKIHAGDILKLPTEQPKIPEPKPTPVQTSKTEWVRIKTGDTLVKISRQQNVPAEDLRRWNRLRGDQLKAGSLLRVSAPQTNSIPPKTTVKRPEPTSPASSSPQPSPPAFVGPARSQIDAPKERLREWEYIVVHHSGTPGGNAKIFDFYHRQTRGMENGLAYHFVIGNGSDSGDGQIEVGPRWLMQKQGGHLASESLNEIAIGICLVGDFSTHRLGPRQTAALIELVQYLRKMMPDAKLKFRLHREINTKPTECPGKLFPSKAVHDILDAN